jgi:hypothetical protein
MRVSNFLCRIDERVSYGSQRVVGDNNIEN